MAEKFRKMGALKVVNNSEIEYQSKMELKTQLDWFNANITRKAVIRYLTVILDFSSGSLKLDLRPNRATVMKEKISVSCRTSLTMNLCSLVVDLYKRVHGAESPVEDIYHGHVSRGVPRPPRLLRVAVRPHPEDHAVQRVRMQRVTAECARTCVQQLSDYSKLCEARVPRDFHKPDQLRPWRYLTDRTEADRRRSASQRSESLSRHLLVAEYQLAYRRAILPGEEQVALGRPDGTIPGA